MKVEKANRGNVCEERKSTGGGVWGGREEEKKKKTSGKYLKGIKDLAAKVLFRGVMEVRFCLC